MHIIAVILALFAAPVPSCAALGPSAYFGWSNPDQVARTLYTSGPARLYADGVTVELPQGYAPPPEVRYAAIESDTPVTLYVCMGGATPPDRRIVRAPLVWR